MSYNVDQKMDRSLRVDDIRGKYEPPIIFQLIPTNFLSSLNQGAQPQFTYQNLNRIRNYPQNFISSMSGIPQQQLEMYLQSENADRKFNNYQNITQIQQSSSVNNSQLYANQSSLPSHQRVEARDDNDLKRQYQIFNRSLLRDMPIAQNRIDPQKLESTYYQELYQLKLNKMSREDPEALEKLNNGYYNQGNYRTIEPNNYNNNNNNNNTGNQNSNNNYINNGNNQDISKSVLFQKQPSSNHQSGSRKVPPLNEISTMNNQFQNNLSKFYGLEQNGGGVGGATAAEINSRERRIKNASNILEKNNYNYNNNDNGQEMYSNGKGGNVDYRNYQINPNSSNNNNNNNNQNSSNDQSKFIENRRNSGRDAQGSKDVIKTPLKNLVLTSSMILENNNSNNQSKVGSDVKTEKTPSDWRVSKVDERMLMKKITSYNIIAHHPVNYYRHDKQGSSDVAAQYADKYQNPSSYESLIRRNEGKSVNNNDFLLRSINFKQENQKLIQDNVDQHYPYQKMLQY